MRKALFVFALAMAATLFLAPVMAEAHGGRHGHWGYPGWYVPFVYPEPQIVYPYPAPPVIYPAPPPVMYPAPPQVVYAPPQVIYAPSPPVMIQIPPAAPMPQQPPRHHVLKSGGATIVTKCSNCTVTNTINEGKAAVKQSGRPSVERLSPSADSWLAIWLVAAAVVILVLFSIVINQRMTRQRFNHLLPAPGPAQTPAANARTDAARRPRPRVHRRKCEHPDCHHKIEICCHAEENGGSQHPNTR